MEHNIAKPIAGVFFANIVSEIASIHGIHQSSRVILTPYPWDAMDDDSSKEAAFTGNQFKSLSFWLGLDGEG